MKKNDRNAAREQARRLSELVEKTKMYFALRRELWLSNWLNTVRGTLVSAKMKK